MKQIYLTFLTQKKDEKKLAYEDMALKANMSKSKLQRIFTGQTDPTMSDLEDIVEKALGASMQELHALVGAQEMADSEELNFKGARALMEDFAAEKKQIRAEYQTRIDQLVATSDERQKAFITALEQIGGQYRTNAVYLTNTIKDNENYIRDLLAKTEQANAIAASAQKRAEEAESKIKSLDKRRYQVFFGMLSVVFALLLIISISLVVNIPSIGWGNS